MKFLVGIFVVAYISMIRFHLQSRWKLEEHCDFVKVIQGSHCVVEQYFVVIMFVFADLTSISSWYEEHLPSMRSWLQGDI